MATIADRKLFFINQYFYDMDGRHWSLVYSRKARGWGDIEKKANQDRHIIADNIKARGFKVFIKDMGHLETMFNIDNSGDTFTLCIGGKKSFTGIIEALSNEGDKVKFVFKNGKFKHYKQLTD